MYQKTVDIWTADASKLTPGQHVMAGEDGPRGAFFGVTKGGVAVAWRDNASRYAAGKAAYNRKVRDFAIMYGR